MRSQADADRMKAALKENLKRRKAQAKGRKASKEAEVESATVDNTAKPPISGSKTD